MFKIALDAGHGKYTSGKRCLKSLDPKETREWFLNARICDRIEKLLKDYVGYALLRVDDITGETDVPLKTRTKAANDWGADIYLSVHHNAGLGGRSGGGAVTIIYTNPSAKSIEYQKIIHTKFINSVGKFGNRSEEMPRQNLHVCRETNMPSVLIECGFMDSPTDVPLILSADFAEKAAVGLTAALVAIGNLKPKDNNKNIENKGDLPVSQYEELKKENIALQASVNHLMKEVEILRDKQEKVYHYNIELPEWGQATMDKLIAKGLYKGLSESDLNLPESLLRTLVINDRAGLYD
jgi:N-acetylmuramoyl-L-alanine amidase